MRRILPHLKANVFFSLLVAIFYTAFPNTPHLAGHVHTITGSFLGLLIAFRTNTVRPAMRERMHTFMVLQWNMIMGLS